MTSRQDNVKIPVNVVHNEELMMMTLSQDDANMRHTLQIHFHINIIIMMEREGGEYVYTETNVNSSFIKVQPAVSYSNTI